MAEQQKRGPGRPKGSRNKVDIQTDITRALKEGMQLTDIKLLIEESLVKAARSGDFKNTVGLSKQIIDMIKYLHKMEMELNSEGDKGGKSEDPEEEPEFGKVFNFGRKDSK